MYENLEGKILDCDVSDLNRASFINLRRLEKKKKEIHAEMVNNVRNKNVTYVSVSRCLSDPPGFSFWITAHVCLNIIH